MKLFRSLDNDWTPEEFNETMKTLIAKSLAEKVVIGNIEYFRLTPLGEIVGKHLDSDPNLKN